MTSLLIAFFITFATSPMLANQLSQIVIPFTSKKPFKSSYNQAQNKVVVYIKDTNPEDIEEYFNYDERFIKRILFFSKNNSDTEIQLVLKDNRVKTSIYSFNEPFRIVLDFYSQDPRSNRSPSPLLTLVPSLKPETSLQNNSDSTTNDLPSNTSENKRKLLQPRPENFDNSDQLATVLAKTKAGPGPKWKTYPPYIYRTNISPYKTGANYKEWQAKNLEPSNTNALADYAAKLFDFGHEHRALAAYQKVLHENPIVFSRDPNHLWRLAEIHLGRGNLALANGYYASLRENAPDHPLAQYAALRSQDIASIKAFNTGKHNDFPKIVSQLSKILDETIPEIKLQKAIRAAYWDQKDNTLSQISKNKDYLPTINQDQYVNLENNLQNAENPKSAFLASSLMLNQSLTNADQWNQNLTSFAAKYFSKYQGSAAEPYRTELIAKTRELIKNRLISLNEKRKYNDAINLYKSLPNELNETNQSYEVLWSIANSYQNIPLNKEALTYFQKSASIAPNNTMKFRSLYYALKNASDVLDIKKLRDQNPNAQTAIRRTLRKLDQDLESLWAKINPKERETLALEMNDINVRSLSTDYQTAIQAHMLLWSWENNRSSREQSSLTDQPNEMPALNPIKNKVLSISMLAKRFSQLGKQPEEIRAKNLLKDLDPKEFSDDQESSKLWAKELISLAEVYRKNNQYLEAGRIYTLTGTKANNWDGKAEALYKGGLLLFRSGKKDEAIDALNKAVSNGDNLLYAELAKKRLEQLNDL